MREILAIFKGLYITLKHNLKNIFKNQFTIQYPDIKRRLPERARWALRLQRHEDGLKGVLFVNYVLLFVHQKLFILKVMKTQ